MWRHILAYLFAFAILLAIVFGFVFLRDQVSAGLWLALSFTALAVGAMLVNLVWQWADRDPHQ